MTADFHFWGIFPCSKMLLIMLDNPLEIMFLAAFMAFVGRFFTPEDLLFGNLVMCFIICAGVTWGRLKEFTGSFIVGCI